MNVFTSGSRHQPWIWQVTFLCFLLGFLVAASLQTVSSVRRLGGNVRVGGGMISINPNLNQTVRKLTDENARLNEQKTKLEQVLAQGSGEAKALNEELQKAKVLAGLTPVKGPGVVLILQDSKTGPPPGKEFDRPNYIIHDWTMQQVINELNASGAEAISINGQRIVSRTPIRCVGPTALVNNIPISSPFEVKAIGDPATLWGALNIPGGVLEAINSYDPAMARLEKRQELLVPGYTGSTEMRFAHPITPAAKPESGRSESAGPDKRAKSGSSGATSDSEDKAEKGTQ